jgi:thiamine-monophosphate kinase
MREFSLLEHIFAANPTLSECVSIPPGDDMAMVSLRGTRIIAGVDQVVAGRHYRPEVTPVERIGRKAMTRCLSDVAAMAAWPVASLAAVTLPPDFGEERARKLFDAMRATAEQYRAPLVGGDVAFHADPSYPLVCAVTVLAEPLADAPSPVTRAGARTGDRIYVTGRLGGAVGDDGLGRHLDFEPRIDLAATLARRLGGHLHAMIDISDGLGRDAGHIAEQSRVRIVLDAARIPCTTACAGDWRRAAGDGEDYELCFAASAAADVPPELDGVGITPVGEVVGEWGGAGAERPDDPSTWRLTIYDAGRAVRGAELGWEHGSNARG